MPNLETLMAIGESLAEESGDNSAWVKTANIDATITAKPTQALKV